MGRILDTLDKLGLAEETLVLFSSDNGAVVRALPGHSVNGALRGQKTEAYEGGQRVPLLARWPGHIRPSTRSGTLVALTDLLATIADLLGKRLPEGAGPDSFSFLEALVDRKQSLEGRTALVHNSYRGGFGIRQGDWKLLMFQGGGGRPVGGGGWNPFDYDRAIPYGQLYNLREDLGEQRNLYAEEPERVAAMMQLLREIRSSGSGR